MQLVASRLPPFMRRCSSDICASCVDVHGMESGAVEVKALIGKSSLILLFSCILHTTPPLLTLVTAVCMCVCVFLRDRETLEVQRR